MDVTFYLLGEKRPCFYIISHFDWICCDRTEGVCMYVCVCVCVYVCDSATAQTDGWILMKFSTNDLTDLYLWGLSFSDFEISKSMTSWWPSCIFSLGHSQFCSNFLQNWRGGRKLSSAVCYWKSARSVWNFCKYGGLCLRKKFKMAAKNDFFKQIKWDVKFD